MEQPVNHHPASQWALNRAFSAEEVACTTAVVLKILDGKCKMLPGEKAAVLAIYDVLYKHPTLHFSPDTHRQIAAARRGETEVLASIHALRLYAEQQLPKPVMKSFKALLREGLFG